MLHGCNGISSHSIAIADRLGSWGYVALTIDTLGRRGLDACYSGTYTDQAFDAYAALRYLATLEAVNPQRIAVLGQSMGGSAALYALDRDLAARRLSSLPGEQYSPATSGGNTAVIKEPQDSEQQELPEPVEEQHRGRTADPVRPPPEPLGQRGHQHNSTAQRKREHQPLTPDQP